MTRISKQLLKGVQEDEEREEKIVGEGGGEKQSGQYKKVYHLQKKICDETMVKMYSISS